MKLLEEQSYALLAFIQLSSTPPIDFHYHRLACGTILGRYLEFPSEMKEIRYFIELGRSKSKGEFLDKSHKAKGDGEKK